MSTRRLAIVAGLACALITPSTYAQDQAVLSDLRPLLAAPQSELRLVVQRYALDRDTLGGNYAGGAVRGGRGRGAGEAAAASPAAPVPVSSARLTRLKRFDLNWQTSVAALGAAKLTPAAAADLLALKSSIGANLQQLDADALTLARIQPLAPFMSDLVGLIEARIRVDDVDSRKAAGTLTAVTRGIKVFAAAPPKAAADTARRAADATDQLRAGLTEWFNFYNGYDPLFTWWMGKPFTQVDAALQSHAALLRDTVATNTAAVADTPAAVAPVAPAPQPRHADVPDLDEIIALPQDEMRDVVARFNATGGAGRAGGAGVRDTAFYTAWLAALTSLDFDRLSRNAQVDYLFIRRTAETQIARAALKLAANPPRKADNSGIPGPARGRDGLIQDLSEAMIPYTPEQLIALAEKEFAWCDQEMLKASREMGFGADWKKAIEKTKDSAVPPGGQPRLIMDLLTEAVDYLRSNNLVTVPQVASESLHMIMMTPERQLVNPFFTGGSQISVSYPTDTMEYDARIQSMRGNNPGFSHATAFHEMIPGHNMVGFMNQRFNGYRAGLSGGGPFFGEGWPLYWELTLYDMGFDKTPEQKVGALFWRMHRCARIIFSLKFHMGQWSPQEAIDFLVDRVGHERENAIAEVRRSFDPAAGYGPLYQAAYLLGGLQLRGLRRELVDTRIMTNAKFHDEILRQGGMPIALLRLALTRQKLTRDMNVDWEFYGALPR